MGDTVLYTTLEGEGEAEFTEKKSVFIGYAAHVENEEEAQARIKMRKSAFSDARHNVWAYLCNGEIVARYSDDGEPQGTAGVPVLDTVKKSGVTDGHTAFWCNIYFTIEATSLAKSSSRFWIPSPFSKRTKFTRVIAPPATLACCSMY